MVTCILCDEEFKRISWKHLHYKHGLTMEEYRAMGGLTGVEKECSICGKVFVPKQKDQKCCGTKCGDIQHGLSMRGENHPMYGKHFSHSEEAKQKISENNAKYWEGKKRPDVGKKISAKLTGRPNVALAGRKFPGRCNSGAFEPGREPWNKGKEMTSEYCENVRQRMRETGAIRYGPDNPSWKGGITPEYQKLRKSDEYAEWRKAVFERDSFTCYICGQVGGNIVAHHIKRFADYSKLRFEIENGMTMCRSCHSGLHSRGYSDEGTIAEVIQIIKMA